MNFCWKRYKLLGIGGNLLKPIASYLTNRVQSVKIDDLMSTLQNYLMASPRGLLGPFRFLLYVNDLPEPKGMLTVMALPMSTRQLSIVNKDSMTLQRHFDFGLRRTRLQST